MPKKIKSGRQLAIDMLKMSLKYQQAHADETWVQGMVTAWTNKLIMNCSTKQDAKDNRKELDRDLLELIRVAVHKLPKGSQRDSLVASCLLFNLFPIPNPSKRK